MMSIIYMRGANEAIRIARHPILNVNEITQTSSGCNVFTKLDLLRTIYKIKWGYHQMELSPESREITTNVTYCACVPFRYKR